MKKIMKGKGIDVLTIVIILLLVLVGFSLFDYFNEKLSKKEISGDVVSEEVSSSVCGDGACDYVNGEDGDNCASDCSFDFKVIGQKSIKESSRDTVVGNRIYHASGIIVDTSSSPNKIYVVDTGNNRILGFSSLGTCQNNPSIKCTNDLDCSGSTCQLNPD